jgi:hypothetical protein
MAGLRSDRKKSCFTKKIRIDGNWFLGYFMNNDFIESTDAINKIKKSGNGMVFFDVHFEIVISLKTP